MTTGDSPTNIQATLILAKEALNRGDLDEVLELCQEVVDQVGEYPDALYLAAEANHKADDHDTAEMLHRRVIQLAPHHAAAWAGLGGTLFDQRRFSEARSACQRSIRENPKHAEAYWWRGLVREQFDDFDGANRDLHTAHRLNPCTFLKRIPLDDAALQQLLTESVSSLNPPIQAYLASVTLMIEEVPKERVLQQWDPPMSPTELVLYFTGANSHPAADRSWSLLPMAIVLYRRNLERLAHHRSTLLEELRNSILQEVGHSLGFEDRDLETPSLD